jgi:hemoglobin
MPRLTRGIILLLAVLALALSSAVARAQDDKPAGPAPDRKALDGLIYSNLKEVINHGADLYNSGDWNGCYRLWEGALMTLKPMLAHRGELQKAIDTALTNARQDPMLYRRAFVLRTVLDQIRTELKGGAPAKDKTPLVEDQPKKTLWDRLGGEAGVTRIVDDFFNAAVNDPKVDFSRHGKYKPEAAEIVRMKREMVEQVSQATGGPLKYNGPDMKKVHKDMGITDAQFDATAGHIKKALEKNKVADPDVATVMAAVNSYRKEIVAPKKKEEMKLEDKKPDEKKKADKKTEDKKPDDKKKEDPKKEDKKKDDKNSAGAASVQGHVTFQGQPVGDGTITFVKNAIKVQGVLAADGTYAVEGLQPGEYAVGIQGVQANAVPAKYGDAGKSGLAVTIVNGKQVYDINLQ